MGDVGGGWVSYGLEAAEMLRSHISAVKGTEPMAPVTVIVPSNQVGVSIRRQLAAGNLGPLHAGTVGTGLIAVDFLTPYRLAELLGAARLASQDRRPVSTPVVAAAVRQSLAAEPGVFEPVAEHPATEAALVASYKELRDLTEDALAGLAARSRRAAEVVRVSRATRQRLATAWYDEEDLMVAATEAADQDHAAIAALGAVIVYLPQRLSRHAAELLRTVGQSADLTVIAGTTGVTEADAEVARSAAQLGLTDPPPPSPRPLETAVSTARTRIITASDADDEVRDAVRAVVDAVRSGTSLDRIAVLHASVEPYGRLLHDHLHAAGVATNGSAEVPLAGRMASRALLSLLELPATGYRREHVLAWLTGFPVIHQGRWVPTTSWERISRAAGVVLGRAQWDQRLAQLADALDEEATEVEADQEAMAWTATRSREEAARARALREFVLSLIDRLDAARLTPRNWADHAAWTRQLLADALGGPGRQTRWPDQERRAAERLGLAIDRLAALDRVEGPVSLEVFTRTLTVELESDLGRTGRFGEGALVGPVSMGIGVDLDLVVMVGMAEGTFPSTTRDDSLLPDDERAATDGQLALRSGTTDRLHRQFLATVSGTRAHVLCVPRGDLRRSSERVPSRWVLDVASELAGSRWWSDDLLTADVEWVTHIASFDAGLRRAEQLATSQEHRLRHLMADVTDRQALHALATTVDRMLADGVDVLDARATNRLTRFDGNLAGLEVPSPLGSGTSATSLESWAKCPHAYLLQRVLRVQPVEQPETALQITPLDRGNLVHDVLETFIRDVLADGTVPEPDQPWTPEHHVRLADIAVDRCQFYEDHGLTGQAIFWQRDRRKILADLDQVLTEDDVRRRRTNAKPVAAEMPFGFEGRDPVAFPLGDGRTVAVRGKADRVDQAADGTLHVVDYKTGKADRFKGISAEDPHQGGRHLQLAVYGEAVRQQFGTGTTDVEATYWFTSSRGRFAELGYAVTPDVVANVGEAMRTIVDGIENGLFPPHPAPPSTSPFTDCLYCDPDELGTSDLLRQWERKQLDDVVAPYVALIAPPVDETEADA